MILNNQQRESLLLLPPTSQCLRVKPEGGRKEEAGTGGALTHSSTLFTVTAPPRASMRRQKQLTNPEKIEFRKKYETSRIIPFARDNPTQLITLSTTPRKTNVLGRAKGKRTEKVRRVYCRSAALACLNPSCRVGLHALLDHDPARRQGAREAHLPGAARLTADVVPASHEGHLVVRTRT